MKSQKKTLKSAKSATSTAKAGEGFTHEERDAMRERAKELKAEQGKGASGKGTDGEGDLLARIAEMPESDRIMAERLHALIKSTAPSLSPRTWYGMPAYARNTHVVCFFQGSHKFKTRYATLGFSDKANLDKGTMWPVVFALKEMTDEEALKIAALVKKAAG